MTDDSALQSERAQNERYRHDIEAQAATAAKKVRANTAAPASSSWTASGPKVHRPTNVLPLAGRVALREPDPLLGTSFYVGSHHLDADGLFVVSFAAPIAEVFYRREQAQHPTGTEAVGWRTFEAHEVDIVAMLDESLPNAVGDPFRPPTAKQQSVIPVPPAIIRPSPASATPVVPQIVHTPAALGVTPPSGAQPPATSAAQHPAPSKSDPSRPQSADVEIRAEEVVRRALEAPRTGRLRSLLATLQPEQYELVTRPETENLIVQGHPGTGKTVIALHRAAYLTQAERVDLPLRAPTGPILLLGPTDTYVSHVRPVIDELADASNGPVDVRSLSNLYNYLGGFNVPTTAAPEVRVATSWRELGGAVDRAAREHPKITVASRLLEELITGVNGYTGDEEVRAFVRAAKSWSYSTQIAQFHPLLAAVGLAVRHNTRSLQHYRHIIVDEAQDLRPLDWKLVASLLTQAGSITMVGDLQQRRSDFTHDSWDALAVDLEIDTDGSAPLRTITTGFRSTKKILEFASRLYPKKERIDRALRVGTAPEIKRVSPATLARESVKEATKLGDRLGGITAVITMHPNGPKDELTRLGWHRTTDQPKVLEHPNHATKLCVLHPNDARGLEFDGVITVEPADFPLNVGRQGLLFTSLTRATKELVVLHSRPLPKELR